MIWALSRAIFFCWSASSRSRSDSSRSRSAFSLASSRSSRDWSISSRWAWSVSSTISNLLFSRKHVLIEFSNGLITHLPCQTDNLFLSQSTAYLRIWPIDGRHAQRPIWVKCQTNVVRITIGVSRKIKGRQMIFQMIGRGRVKHRGKSVFETVIISFVSTRCIWDMSAWAVEKCLSASTLVCQNRPAQPFCESAWPAFL